MRRTLLMLMMFALLAMPVMAAADDQSIPPEANWTPTPRARQTVDLDRLVSLLVEKGMISTQEYAQLTQPQSSSQSQEGHARVWTWNEMSVTKIRGRRLIRQPNLALGLLPTPALRWTGYSAADVVGADETATMSPNDH